MTLRVWARAFVAGLAACLLLVLTGGRAWAEGGKLVVIADGGGGEKLATAIAKSLPEKWTRSDPKAFAKAAKTRKLPAAATLEKPKTRTGYVDKLGKATGDVSADAALVVRVTPGKKNRKAKIWIVTPSGRTVKEGTISLGTANVNEDAAAVMDEIRPDLSQLGPLESKADPAAAAAGTAATPPPAGAPAATPPPGTTPPPPATPPPPGNDASVEDQRFAGVKPDDMKPASPLLLDASVGIELGWRSLAYYDRVSSRLRPYHIDNVPQPAIALELYPLARSGIKVLQDIGVVGSVRSAFALESTIGPTDTTVQTTWWRADVGMRARFRLGAGRMPPTIGLSGGYGKEVFFFRHPDPTVRGQALSAWYKTLRARLDARVPIGPIAVLGGVAYLNVLEAGEIEDRLRGASVGGVEADLGVALPLGKTFEVRALGNYRRFFYSFAPEPGDELIAGGALDQMFRAQLALAIVF